MKRFGFAKFAPKPKTEKDWVRIYNRHKYEVPTVKKLTLALSAKGPGQTGARYFKAYVVAPLKYWNPNLEVQVVHDMEKPIVPQLLVEFKNGDSKTIDIKGVHMDSIKANLFSLDAARRPGASATENASAPL